MKITHIKSRQVFDSRGNPTVETDIILDNEILGRATVPSGASTGKYEMLELRDQGNDYFGKGVSKAVNHVNDIISKKLIGEENLSQEQLDFNLLDLDGTTNKSNLGANAILSVSLAYAWAVSNYRKTPLYMYIGELMQNDKYTLPRPMFNIINGGRHSGWTTDIQEYMIVPLKTQSFKESMKLGTEIYHSLEKLLEEKNLSINVGNEGGFAPEVNSNEDMLKLIVESIEKTNYKLGEDVAFALDVASSEFFKNGIYTLKKDNKQFNSREMMDYLKELTVKYPIISIEDGLSEDDDENWKILTQEIGNKIQLVGDDLLVTNVNKINKAIEEKTCNSLLVKPNQIGSLTETLNAIKTTQYANWTNIISHRSGETEDVTIAHLAVGSNAGQIKSGAPSRSERVCKYNELLRIEEILNHNL